ncbi:MAG: hypothetical protein AMJ68_00720 [Acidithiobacillales bacterium SG8_45]|jgi:hypothetical protein|nr:MAG: hypothetical protein AMJ68_00720 [Acidithiobacillales bacterium SG8_45]
MTFYSKARAIFPWKTIAAAVLILLVAVVLLVKFNLSYWLNRYTPELEQAITEATGFDTRIEGGISVIIFPAPAVSIRGITLGKKDAQPLLTASELDLGFELLPLLDREFRLYSIMVSELQLRLPVNENGVPVIPPVKTGQATKQAPSFTLMLDSFDSLELRRSEIVLISATGDSVHSINGANLTLRPADIHSVIKSGNIKKLVASASLDFRQARFARLEIGPTQIAGHYESGRLSVDILESELLGGKAKGKVVWLPYADAPSVDTMFSLIGYDTSRSSALFQRKPIANGKLNLDFKLTGKAPNTDTFLRTVAGMAELSGEDLDLLSVDLDQIIEKIIKSQNYNLVDAGAYFFMGPLGMQTTKGLDYAGVLKSVTQTGTASSKVLRIKSLWAISDGIATAQDVALETKRYRIALKGRLNLIKNTFDGIKIAVVDDRGCAIVKQQLDGPMKSPRIGKLNFLLAITQPLLDALGKSAKRLVGSNCTPFYTGALLPAKPGPVAASTEEPAAKTDD